MNTTIELDDDDAIVRAEAETWDRTYRIDVKAQELASECYQMTHDVTATPEQLHASLQRVIALRRELIDLGCEDAWAKEQRNLFRGKREYPPQDYMRLLVDRNTGMWRPTRVGPRTAQALDDIVRSARLMSVSVFELVEKWVKEPSPPTA